MQWGRDGGTSFLCPPWGGPSERVRARRGSFVDGSRSPLSSPAAPVPPSPEPREGEFFCPPWGGPPERSEGEEGELQARFSSVACFRLVVIALRATLIACSALGGLGEGLVGDGEQVVAAIADASERMRAVAAQEVGDQNSLGEVVVTPFALTSAVYVEVKAFHTWGTPRPNSAGPGLSNS